MVAAAWLVVTIVWAVAGHSQAAPFAGQINRGVRLAHYIDWIKATTADDGA